MESAHLELIEQAIGALKVRDILLYSARLARPTPPPAHTGKFDATQLQKRSVKYVVGDGEIRESGTVKLLQVYVNLEIKVTGLEAENPPVYFEIEAEFQVEYEMSFELSEAAIKAFADINSVHNVWPFWRQHVFDAVARGRLPPLEVPLFTGVTRRKKQISAQSDDSTAVN